MLSVIQLGTYTQLQLWTIITYIVILKQSFQEIVTGTRFLTRITSKFIIIMVITSYISTLWLKLQALSGRLTAWQGLQFRD